MSQVSVILCCYNGADFVTAALESVYCQTDSLERYEVIFIDDGSTDGTGEVVQAFRQYPNFRYTGNRRNFGLVPSCNWGLQEARGEYVIRLDADDVFEPTIIEEMRVPLDQGVTDFVYSDRHEMLLDRNEVRYVSLTDFNIYKLIAAGTMMRRSLMLAIGGYRDVFWEEYDLYIRYLLKSDKPPHHIPRPIYTYAIREGSITADPSRVRAGWEELKRLWPVRTLERFGQLPATVHG